MQSAPMLLWPSAGEPPCRPRAEPPLTPIPHGPGWKPGRFRWCMRRSAHCPVLARYGVAASTARSTAGTMLRWKVCAGSQEVGRLYGKKFATRREETDDVIVWSNQAGRQQMAKGANRPDPVVVGLSHIDMRSKHQGDSWTLSIDDQSLHTPQAAWQRGPVSTGGCGLLCQT